MAKSRKSKSKGASSILVIIAVLALLAAIGVAIYELSGQHGGGGNKTCASVKFDCRNGSRKSKPPLCKGDCTSDECCDPPTCKSFKGCDSTQTQKSDATRCGSIDGCTKNDCCVTPPMCSDKITCGSVTAVDTSKQCKEDPCTPDECCTLKAWAENKVKEAINNAVNDVADCAANDKEGAALKAAAKVLNDACKKEKNVSFVECLGRNTKKAVKQYEEVCNSPPK